MSSGPGRPGQPIMGQRPMFGGGSPVFARMPSYTPVTRGRDQGPSQPEPQPAAYPQGAQGYPSARPAPAQPYPSANPAPARPYAGAQQSAPQAYPGGDGYPGQGYADQSYAGQGYPAQGHPSQGYQQASYPAANYQEANYGAANHADASFPEGGFAEDASFPEDTSYSGNGAYPHEEPLNLGMPNSGYGQAPQPYNDQALHVAMASQGGQAAQANPHRALQTFDAPYDQPPQIPLGGSEQMRRGAQGFYEGEHPDADFLDDGQAPGMGDAAVAQVARKATMKGRSMFMVGSALLGAVALGGALAFAYKQSGGAMNGGEPPLVQADNRPVKEAPDQPGGKDFPHKNKLIYDRLENGDKPEAEHIVPRQENVAIPAMPASTDTAGLGAPAGTQTAPPTTEAVAAGSAPSPVATVDDPEGGPRRVKTMVVRPDGSVMPPAGMETAAAAAPAQAPAPQVASAETPGSVPATQPQVQAHLAAAPAATPAPPAAQPPAAPTAQAAAADIAEPQQVASIPPPAPVKPKPVKVATAADTPAPKATPAKSPSQFVVQVGSKQNQTDALATFADMQQKYPTLLSSYRPMVQKADLGAKGVWYRLRIGPINDKTAASKLCSQLKSQGLNDCLVMTE